MIGPMAFGVGRPTGRRCDGKEVPMRSLILSFLLALSATMTGQDNWRWCNKCQGLWFAGSGTSGKCHAGDGHVPQESGNYTLVKDGSGQDNWRWCNKCQGLWFAGSG